MCFARSCVTSAAWGWPATEMVCARGIFHRGAAGQELPDRLWGVAEEPRPLAVQIWDNDPETLAAVGARLAHTMGVSIVDINFGCPVRDVSEKGRKRFVSAARSRPRGYDRCPRRPSVPPDAGDGQDPPWLHARYDQRHRRGAGDRRGGGRGSNRSRPHRARHVPRNGRLEPHRGDQAALEADPLIGNGDLRTTASAIEAFERFGVDGVMIGRAGLARPWLFRQIERALRGEPLPPDPTPSEQRRLLLDHYRLIVERFGPDRGTILMRRYACCYAQGRQGGPGVSRRGIARQDAGRVYPSGGSSLSAFFGLLRSVNRENRCRQWNPPPHRQWQVDC